MGVEIKAGLDNIIDDIQDLSGSDVGFASNLAELADALRSNKNDLGTASKRDTGTDAGGIPLINANGHIETSIINTSVAGGASASGKIPLLGSTGQLSSAMIPISSLTNGGFKYVWKFDNLDTNGRQPSLATTNRQYNYTWTPVNASGTYTGVTSIICFVTGGGGCGSYGPASSGARKGGGGGAGGTAIRIFTGITSASSYSVKVGQGGAARPYGQSSGIHNGSNSSFQSVVTGLGGAYGSHLGAGGDSGTTNIDQAGFGIYIPGGMGHDGLSDKFGGGSGGASFWGGGYSGGDGQGSDSGRHAAPGAGGGSAHGHNASTGAFNANTAGTRGNNGIVVIIGI